MHTQSTQMEILEDEANQYKKIQEQKQLQRFKRNKFVGLKNTGNLCYLNSTIQVIFNLPLMCDAVIQFFEGINSTDLNETTKEFLYILKQKKQINEKDDSDVENIQLDLSKLRKAFNYDLEKRHREKDNTFGYGQNDSSEFYILLFEFLVKFRKDQDLKRKNAMLGVGNNSDNPPSIIERMICKKNFNFGKSQAKLEEYFINETAFEDQLLEEQIQKMENCLKNTQNPIEKYFFNGFLMTNLGPCRECNYYSLSVHDFAFFELNFPEDRYGWNTYSLQDLIKPYFKQERVNSRCKNSKCDHYPVRIVREKSERTLYFPTIKNSFLIKLPSMLKIMFKKYEGGMSSGSWFGRRISNKVELPVVLKGNSLAPFYYKTGCLKIDKQKDQLLTLLATESQKYNFYLFAYSTQSGSLDSGHYVSHSLQYYEKDNEIYFYYHLLNDSFVDKPQLGGKVSQSIECDAYWAMYVREDQEDFKNQLIHNECPVKTKQGFSFV